MHYIGEEFGVLGRIYIQHLYADLLAALSAARAAIERSLEHIDGDFV